MIHDCDQLQHAYLDTGDMLSSNKVQCDTGITDIVEGLESSGKCKDSSIRSNNAESESNSKFQHAHLDLGDFLSNDTPVEGFDSSGNCNDPLSIKSNNTDAESESNSKFQHAYLDLGDFLSDDTPTNGRGVAVNDFPSSDVFSNDRETIDHLYFTSEDYQSERGYPLHFRHTDSDDAEWTISQIK